MPRPSSLFFMPLLLPVALIVACSAATALYQPEISHHAEILDAATLNLQLPGYTALRLEGLDAPDASFVCTRAGQPWNCGAEARAYLTQQIADKPVSCKPTGVDAEHRTVARCWIYDASGMDPQHHGRNLSELMLSNGYAFPTVPTPGGLQIPAARARAAHIGVWAADNLTIHPPVPPSNAAPR